ncbi:CDP-glycerol glycerophosphotransferase family protein [Phenylobacterium sp.]|uniref:CDP-glycerol glycerophosphotransferase family protein n=1 Tax=Phenylobacterium sp. TaxID=1871053 RepID=UPI0028124216|nr:CDP-glycerol glycerophosphotransferase family protein [Phenylobacterium sp.]
MLRTARRGSAEWGRASVAALHRQLSGILHTRGRVCVYGWPDHEENSLYAAALLAGMPGLRVTLLADKPDLAAGYLRLVCRDPSAVEVVAKNSITGLLRASAAEVLLFTHGLYGSPDLTDRKLVINLWHGYGPKANDNAAFSARIPFSVLFCNTPVWGAAAARWLGAADARLRCCGNPREIAFSHPAPPASLARLGLEQERFVLWMPTYRGSNGAAGPRWRDAPDLRARVDAAGMDPVSALQGLADAAGVKVVVKPHPLDVSRFDGGGLHVVTTEELLANGVTLYQLIAASAGMISDYSSAWVEYLDLDRPLVLYCPDLSDYIAGRGFSEPSMVKIAPGLIVETPLELTGFFEALATGTDWRARQRHETQASLGLRPGLVDAEAFRTAFREELDRRRLRSGRTPRPARRDLLSGEPIKRSIARSAIGVGQGQIRKRRCVTDPRTRSR